MLSYTVFHNKIIKGIVLNIVYQNSTYIIMPYQNSLYTFSNPKFAIILQCVCYISFLPLLKRIEALLGYTAYNRLVNIYPAEQQTFPFPWKFGCQFLEQNPIFCIIPLCTCPHTCSPFLEGQSISFFILELNMRKIIIYGYQRMLSLFDRFVQQKQSFEVQNVVWF